MTAGRPRATPTRTYEIRDGSGALVAYHDRYEDPDRGKWFAWRSADGSPGLQGLRTNQLPLYGIERLDKRSRVVVVEGEKAADALRTAGFQAVGTVTGAAAVPGGEVLAELGGRQVILWPDADEPGRAHMNRIARELAGIAASVALVDWAEAPEHGDAADFLATRDTLALEELFAAARPVEPPEPAARSGAAVARNRLAGRGSTAILELVDDVELFHDEGGKAYADVLVGGHRATFAVLSRLFENWLAARYWGTHAEAASDAAFREALRAIEARARFDGPERPVFLRVGRLADRLYVDLADEAFRAVEIDASGWRILPSPRVHFRRGSSPLALPAPTAGGSIAEFREFVNVADERQYRLLIAWLVFAAMPDGPFPPLLLGGQQDSGKTTLARVLRALLDPCLAATTTAPRDEEELFVTADQSALLVFDNLSGISGWLSDALCRLADGSAMQRRARYTDGEVVTITARRPVIVTGIGDLAARGDLLSRALTLTLPSVADEARQREAAFWAAFAKARPSILGALYDLVAGVLRIGPTIELDRAPRMADFARTGVALERLCGWPTGAFLEAYQANRAASHERSLEAYPIVDVLLELAAGEAFDGSATELLRALDELAGDDGRRRRGWPSTANALSNQLARLAPSLLAHGIDVRSREVRGVRRWRISRVAELLTTSSAPSAPHGLGADPPIGGTRLLWDAAGADRGADGGGDPLDADQPPLLHRREQSEAPSVDQGADGADGADRISESSGWPSKDDRTREVVGAALESGRLDGLELTLGPGIRILDAAKAAREDLAAGSGTGPVADAARQRLGRLAAQLEPDPRRWN